jgi:hypothetical protein
VQQQTLDVAMLLRRTAPLAQYFMTFEDDLESCDNAIAAIQYAINKVLTGTRRHANHLSTSTQNAQNPTFTPMRAYTDAR